MQLLGTQWWCENTVKQLASDTIKLFQVVESLTRERYMMREYTLLIKFQIAMFLFICMLSSLQGILGKKYYEINDNQLSLA